MKYFKSNFILLIHLLTGLVATSQENQMFAADVVKPRIRVMIDNDFGGDPDGLFQLVHQVLSPSVEIRGIIGSHLKPSDGFDPSDQTATNAVKAAKDLLQTMNLNEKYPFYQGSNSGLVDAKTPRLSDAAKAIVKEAMRDDTSMPLYIVCGAGLTEIASAYLMEPKISKRLTLVWIGGPEHAGLALPPPGYTRLEYNLGIDIPAAQTIFNISDIPLWQIPRNIYRQALFSYSELLLHVKPKGMVGEYLCNKLESIMKRTQKFNLLLGETYILGDSPLVLLTALQSSFEADPSSSMYALIPAPKINELGMYEVNTAARNIRVYTNIDNRLLFSDFISKLALFNARK